MVHFEKYIFSTVLHMQWGVWGPTFILDWLQFLLILSKQVSFLLVATHI